MAEGYAAAMGKAGAAAEGGEESALQAAAVDLVALVGTYSAVLYRVAYSVLRQQSEAEDVVQDAFVRVLQHTKALPAVRDMRVWLIRIVWNLAMDRRRRVRPEQLDTEFAAGLVGREVGADRAMEEAGRMQSVMREVQRLNREERQALLLSAVDELGTAEIALVMERSEAAVRGLLFRGRARLRERLERRMR
jgi:RNA polymerase sigma-70 factor (ECF subfamily)